MPKRHDPALKEQVLLALRGGETLNTAADRFGVPYKTVYCWAKADGLAGKPAPQADGGAQPARTRHNGQDSPFLGREVRFDEEKPVKSKATRLDAVALARKETVSQNSGRVLPEMDVKHAHTNTLPDIANPNAPPQVPPPVPALMEAPNDIQVQLLRPLCAALAAMDSFGQSYSRLSAIVEPTDAERETIKQLLARSEVFIQGIKWAMGERGAGLELRAPDDSTELEGGNADLELHHDKKCI